ncbi:MAG: hypothetical protein Q9171_005101 [Xanthocarpia ochracea]
MDISSLLSPQDSPRTTPQPSKATPKTTRKPRATKSTAPPKLSPPSRSARTNAPNATYQTDQQIVRSPPIAHPVSAMRMATENTSDGGRAARQGSTPGMDALADLASMQHHQQTTRANAGTLRNTEIYDNQGSPNGAVLQNLHVVHGPLPGRASIDHTMADTSSQPAILRNFTTKTLSDAETQDAENLIAHLASNQFDYESHVRLIRLLHRAFRSHIRGSSPLGSQVDPRNYELLPSLRAAREAMDAQFAVGEELWVERIEDEELIALTLPLDECVTVMNLYDRAVQEEVVSTRLWLGFAKWMTSLYVAATQDALARETVDSLHEIHGWSDEDKVVAGELYNWQFVLDVWALGAKATKWRIDESHLLWDPYTALRLQNLERSPSTEGAAELKAHFLDRLQTPHATWEQTFQMFSTFISRYEDHSYERIMATVNQQCATAKAAFGMREMFELAVKRAHESGDKATQLNTFNEYIEWEASQSRRKHAFVFELVDTLYQRALLGSPANTELWEAYVMFLNEEIVSHSRRDVDLLSVLDRSTRHCPWSGSLWSQYLLAAERQRMPFPDIGQIKHKATSTGLLDAGGLEEVLKVYVAWCSILRRRAFQEESTDEELDVAEVGIRSAIEDMQRLGEVKYGKEYQGDPNYRLERIYINYLTQSRNWHTAREYWKSLIPSQGDSHEFWLRYYLWEMSAWGKISYSENAANAPSSPRPSEATRVLRTALKRSNLDWPEKLIQALQYHCEDHEDAMELQSASIQIWKTNKVVQKRREKEAIEAYEAAQAAHAAQAQAMQHIQTLNAETSTDSAVSFTTSKRKREHETNEVHEEAAPKKTRRNYDNEPTVEEEAPSSIPSKLRRDRENATVIVKNLPQATAETRIRQYFRNCGSINTLLLNVDELSNTATATIEFQTRDDALTALTKDKKDFDGRDIGVQLGSGSTVYTTNFPPEADESWIRETFGKYGEVIDVRYPSLKYNTHRRFCYVQFSTADEAHKATELHGLAVGANLKLVARMSDPSQRHSRVGALEEGREIHVVNLHWDITERELVSAFSRYGTIEKTTIPTHVSGKSKGFAFVTFKSKNEAIAALELNQTTLMGRTITVEIASKAPTKRQATTILQNTLRSSNSPSPDVQVTNGNESTAESPGTVVKNGTTPTSAEIRARTVVLLNVPDTVNDARIRTRAERYGPLVKIVLRPDHQGAIIEFRDVTDAGKAALELDGDESLCGRTLRVGDMRELLQQQPERKNDKPGPKTGKSTVSSGALQSAMPIRRPVQLGVKRGGRGGLGSAFRAPAKNSNKVSKDPEINGVQKVEEAAPKSNADFKALFLGQEKD